MDIFNIKLVNGDDIIALVDTGGRTAAQCSRVGCICQGASLGEGERTKIKLTKPAAIMITADQSGRPKVGMADYLMFAEKKEILVDESHILFMYEPAIDFINAYNQLFGSGIVLPPKASVLPFTM